ncbi:hypothetical protein HK105_209349 [Polyrhizophydium stewartii]|uniref:VWFA domain-containing protein n=1 Tax=Polyrhizophydium stewartii TaxID=2732419 RepID=A0ABR4MVC3_9FUNG|nr:hypothetical protein HK105_006731 [Polyrhizophydium stewartii]
MKLSTHIVLRLIVPLGTGMVILGVLTLAVIFSQSPGWISKIEASIKDNQVAAFAQRARTRALVVQAAINGYSADAQVAGAYTRDLLGLGGTASPALPVTRSYTNYFGALLDGRDPPQPTDPLTSFYFSVDVTTAAQFNAVPTNTTVLDNSFRALLANKPNVQAWQLGLPDKSWRRFPYAYKPNDYYRQQNPCQTSPDPVPPEVRNAVGYIPLCRNWYILSKAAAEKAGASVNGVGPTIFTPPYRDTSNKRVKIGSAVSVVGAAGTAVAALSVDVQIDFITDQLTKNPVLTNGYIFMMDAAGNMVVYPTNKAPSSIPDIYNQTLSIADLEFGGSTTLLQSFLTTVRSIAGQNNTAQITKPGSSDSWYVAANPVSGTSYYVVSMVPAGDITALSSQMRMRTTIFGIVAGVVMLVALVAAIVIAWRVITRETDKVLRPIAELGNWLTSVSEADLSRELGNKAPVSAEINIIHDHFKNLLIAIRFGNEAYYANDLNRALSNYEAAERMMVQFRNERGRGICLNNKGNTYKQMDHHFREALNAYTLAIQNAEALIAEEKSPSKKQAYEIVLANRQMNLGVLYKEYEPATPETISKAEFYFSESLRLHRKNDNVEGIAQVSGNLGQLYLSVDRVSEAAQLLDDSYTVCRERGNEISLQYAMMNMGILAEHVGHLDEAIAWYSYVLQHFKTVVYFVQRFCYEHLIRIYESEGVNRKDLADALRELGMPIFGNVTEQGSSGVKDVAFVLDCSGSMAGAYIRACRESIISILTDFTDDGDRISLTTFQDTARRVFALTMRTRDSLPSMVNSVTYDTATGGTTAFWDALHQAIVGIAEANQGGSSGRKIWVVALTDGYDNASNKASRVNVLNALRSHNYIGLVVITVGSLSNEHEIREACHVSRDGGLLIRAEASSEAIRDAFGRAARLMTGHLNVESL